ncbi:MAG TPA: nucleoside transporter C-terminal domain-containing protein [Pirellulales bacterium]|jgi:CNT family concentrative nucleoside transporter|nr:nucleoside transporter C-terminal domain-containing protein [Pirellulales bacterium]
MEHRSTDAQEVEPTVTREEPVSAPPTVAAPISPLPPMPLVWRLGILAAIAALGGAAYLFQDAIGLRGQAFVGVFVFFGLVAGCSRNLRAVNWRTIGWGFALQLILAVLVLKVPTVYKAFEAVGHVVKSFIGFSDEGARFVFGNLADARAPENGGTWSRLFGEAYSFQFAFVALPPILFVSAFFTVLYHYGVLQRCVQVLAVVMRFFMRTSGAETLAVSANVFMGQTEAPLIVKPYVPRMTQSEMFAMMASGFAHISGGMMVVYINYGADPVAILTTCVMACPCSLYLAKLFLPECETPETATSSGLLTGRSQYVNGIDAMAAGTGDGLRLALNVGAMLIVFIAFVAMFDAVLAGIKPLLIWLGLSADLLVGWPDDLSLRKVFGWLFSPAAFLMGVESDDVQKVGSLLGSKLAINEHYAYLQMKAWKKLPDFMTDRSYKLTAFALTGFANFASIGIQLGGIGAIAPDRRHDLARLGARALFVGFTATLLNAAIAGVMIE